MRTPRIAEANKWHDKLCGFCKEKPAFDFVESPEFVGSKSGYYFGTGNKGTGYYSDAQARSLRAYKQDIPEYSLSKELMPDKR